MSKKIEPTEPHHLEFFDYLVEDDEVTVAAEKAGISKRNAYKLARQYREYLLNRIEDALLFDAVRARKIISDTMTTDGTTPMADLRFKAGLQVLDRVGMAKKERLEIKVESENGLFILPGKDISHADEKT